ncbi:solute carrier family 49 member 4 homolog isoform X2 [Crassostrea angulata]|uniref:solute carrier family 49 member 4 homolog isoform X2 n=1 Tax=Magallana angulata TaxID=2784310 RepID=UPI0022B1A4F7|nr:solute carrier family 49 member 4 homolog isoform X2 [Crassostrea angulata]
MNLCYLKHIILRRACTGISFILNCYHLSTKKTKTGQLWSFSRVLPEDMTTESSPETELQVYGVRWYLLSVVSLNCCLQTAVWAEFPPIAQSAKLVYDWSDSDINMSLNYGNIGTIVLLPPMIWIVFTKGMRTAVILSTFLMAAGTGLKALPVGNDLNSWLIPIGLFLNGCAYAMTAVGATVLSETWFPPSQRATATVIYIISAAAGGALVFIVGPAVVPEPIALCDNITWSMNSNCSEQNKTYTNSYEVHEGLKVLNVTASTTTQCHGEYTTTGAGGGIQNSPPAMEILALGVVLCYSRLSFQRVDYDNGSRATPIWDISKAGWMSFSGAIGGTLFGMVLSRLSDVFYRKMKVIMMVMFSIATVSLLLFILILIKVLSNEHWSFYFTFIAACVVTLGTQPLYYEIACENLFPVSEAVISGLLGFLNIVSNTLFLLVTIIPNIGTMWLNWAVFVTSLLSVVVLYLFKEEYRRMDIDLPVSQSKDSKL